MTVDQPQSETPRRKEFQDGLQLLTGITSWQLRSGILVMTLLTGAIALLLLRTLDSSLPTLGLLVLACAVSGVTFHRQRRGLKLLREGLLDQMHSVIKQRVKAEQFYGMATQDALTGLYNRRFGETRLQEEIASAEKCGEPLILIAADFDRFKQINDRYGHAAGDLALKEFSRRLQRAVRACDIPVRVGGDEFLVIFPECVLEKIPEIMSRMDSIAFSFEGNKIPVSFSYGAAQYEPNDTPESLLRRADERLYARKAKRKAARQEEARSIVANANFRRSERVSFEMPVQVYVPRENEEPTHEEAKSLSVNAHGALLALKIAVEMGNTLRLVNPRTQQEMECRVCRFGKRNPTSATEVGIEFARVAPAFWDVPCVPADWNPWAPQEVGQSQESSLTSVARPVAPRKNAISHLSEDIAMAFRGSGSAGWNPPWATQPESERAEASASGNADAAPPVSSPTEALSVIWDDKEKVKDVSRLAGLVPTWIPQSASEAPKTPSAKEVGSASPLAGGAGGLEIEGGKIVQEALQTLEKPSEDTALATKAAHARASKWLVVALAFAVALIALWFATPRGSAGATASAGIKDRMPSVQPNEKASRPSVEATQLTSSKMIESTVLGTHPCAVTAAAAPGMLGEVARITPRSPGFRLATKEDFDPEGVSWLQKGGQEVSSQIPGDFTGSGESRGYLWVGNNKSWHVVLLANNQTRCDVSLPSVAVAAFVPKESMNKIQWDGPAPPESSGDGLLVVGSTKDPASSVVLSLQGTDIVASRPADYRQVPIGERKQ